MNEYDSNRIYDLVSTIGFKKTDIKKVESKKRDYKPFS